MKEAQLKDIEITQELKKKFGRMVSLRLRHLYHTDRTFARKVDAIGMMEISDDEKAERCVKLAVESFKRMPPRDEEKELYEEVRQMIQKR